MSGELIVVLCLLGAAVIMFAFNKPRMDAVGLIMIFTLPFTGIITLDEALSGFSDSSVILIALLFVIGDSLARTGIVQAIGDWLIKKSDASETKLLIFLMITVAGIGSFMSSTGVVALFIPVVLRIAKRSDIAPGQLMMPLAYGALLSGMMTLVATPPNLIVNGELLRNSSYSFGFFSFTPFGLPLLLIAIPYMYFARRFLSSASKDEKTTQRKRPQFADWIEQYHLNNREARIKIQAHSQLIGKTLAELNLRQHMGINILAIERHVHLVKKLITPRPDTILQRDDILLLDIVTLPQDETISELCRENRLTRLKLTGRYFTDSSQQLGMAEAMVPVGSALIGYTVVERAFRNRFDLTVIGLKRGQNALSENITEEKLALGDVLLLIGPWRAIRRMQTFRQELVVLDLPEEVEDAPIAPARAPYALLAVVMMVALMVGGILPNVLAALLACLMLGLFRCINLDAAYRAIHWPSLILIAGMLPFSYALQKTGGVGLASDGLLALADGYSPRIILAALFAVTALLGLFISNTATAVLMAPVAITLAQEMHASPLPFAMTVALAASSAFMTPVSSPVNALVVGPGRYTFFDFVKIGVPFTLIAMVLCVFLVPVILPF